MYGGFYYGIMEKSFRLEVNMAEEKDEIEQIKMPDEIVKTEENKPQQAQKVDYSKMPMYAKHQRMQELAVITNGKKLCEYVYTITQNSPKKFRWSLVAKMQECCFDYVNKLYFANELPPKARLLTILEAQSLLKMFDFNCQMSKSCGAITHKQFNHISELIYQCRVTLRGWAKIAANYSALKEEKNEG